MAGLSIAAFLAVFGCGLWVGRWGGRRQYKLDEAKRRETAVAQSTLLVVGAVYGAQGVWFDVTEKINAAIKNGNSKLDVNDVPLLSPDQVALAVEKKLIFAYVYGEQFYAKEAAQNQKLGFEKITINVV